jgi:hypothetical protein
VDLPCLDVVARLIVVLLIASCGRVAFDPLEPADAPADSAPDTPPRVACTVAQCPAGFAVVDGGCYRVGITPRSWLAAELDCEAVGAHLIVEDSIQEHTTAHDLATAAGVTRVWVGWSDRRGPDNVFTWVAPDAGGLLQTDPCVFGSTEPDAGDADHCAVQAANNSCPDYQDVSCDLLESYICECDGQLADPARY